MKTTRMLCALACLVLLGGCGFHLRGEADLPAALQRVHVASSDPFSPLPQQLEAALRRAGASVQDTAAKGVAEVTLSNVSLAPVVRSVGANAFVNEFTMVYHVELIVSDGNGVTLLPRQVIEHTREFTFDQSQAIGTQAEQDEIRKGMQREMLQAIVYKIEAIGRQP